MRLKLGRLFLVSIFIIAILTAPSLAVKTVTYTSDLPPKNVGIWDRNHTLPLFDPALGNLVAVNFTASLNATADAKAENVAPDGGVDDAYIDVDADMYVDMINGDRLTLVLNLATTPTDLSAFDGVLDYGGTSGFSIIKEGDTVGSIYYNDARKNAYVGTGTIDLKAHATAKSQVVGSGTWESRLITYSWSNASITYTYDECHSCISGYKINSSTGAGLPDWNITLTNATGSLTKKTGPDGKYEFCNLQPGSYTVCEEQKDGWKNTTPSCITVPLGCSDSKDNNFTNVPEREKACETFWANWNGNGICLIPGCASNWGWYLKPSIADLKAGITSDLWAAAGQCKLSKGYNVGKVTLKLDNTKKIVTLHFNLTGVRNDCDLNEWHLWVSDSSLCPHKGFSKWIKGTAEDIQIDLGSKLIDLNNDGVFVAVHGVACCDKCGTNECTYR